MSLAEPEAVLRPSTEFVRPLRLGLSIGHPTGPAGCLGPFVTLADGRAGFLSAAHVLAPMKSRIGDFIHQPSPIEALTTGETRIAQLAAHQVPEGDQTSLGIALAVLLEQEGVANLIPPGEPDTGRPIGPPGGVPPARGESVRVFGRSEGLTEGRISAVNVSNLRVMTPDGPVVFADCLELRAASGGALTSPGDAGALVCRAADLTALALVFAAVTYGDGSQATFALPLAPALAFFEARWA